MATDALFNICLFKAKLPPHVGVLHLSLVRLIARLVASLVCFLMLFVHSFFIHAYFNLR